MMFPVATFYDVRIVNSYEEFDKPQVVTFRADNPESVERLIAAYSGYYSGDPVEFFINGEKAVTHLDWGLVTPKGEE